MIRRMVDEYDIRKMDFCDGGEADEWVQNAPTVIPEEEEHTMEEFMYGQEGNPNDGSM